MPKLTQVKETKRGRYALFFDGEFAFSLDEDTFAMAGLHTGDELEEWQIHDLQTKSDTRKAVDKAACVDNNNVRLFGVRNRLVARLDQRVAEYISIDLVFGASKGNNCNIHVWLFLSLFSVCYVGLCRLLGQNSGKAIRSVH